MNKPIKATVQFLCIAEEEDQTMQATVYITPGQGFKELEQEVKEELQHEYGAILIKSIVFD